MSETLKRKLRCAIYTRKSTDEGLDKEFNSLDAQREAGEALTVSRRAEGWIPICDRYDDGGFSGSTLERPALKRLIADAEDGNVDVVVVYKIDRLSRSLLDFAKLVDIFDRNDVSVVSVTQSFNTKDTMGRLTLNILLSFAQFEREVIGDRIRDKFAASRKKGLWMGGVVPLGYVVKDRKLIINDTEAEVVRKIFEGFVRLGSATKLAEELLAQAVTTRSGKPIDKGFLYKLLNNRVHLGLAVHKGTAYPGEHQAIISQDLWDKVHSIMKISPHKRAGETRCRTPALLKGLIFAPGGIAMSPTHTRHRGRLYRYYTTQTLLKRSAGTCPVGRVPAGDVEAAVVDQLRTVLRSPEIIVGTWRTARHEAKDLKESEVCEAVGQLDPLWHELFPVEQARIVQLLIERVDVDREGLDIRLRAEGFSTLARELRSGARNASTKA